MNHKDLIIVLIICIFIISIGLFFYIHAENVNRTELNNVSGKLEVTPYKDKVSQEFKVNPNKDNVKAKTTIRAATKEEIIVDFMQTKLLTYEEAEELYKKEQRINHSGYDEKIKTAILQKTYYYDSIGICFDAVIKYVYSVVENEPISIDYIGKVHTDIVGEAKLVRFLSMEDPIIDYNNYRLEITHFGKPIIEVDNNTADILINKYNFELVNFNLYNKILKPENPLSLDIDISLEDLRLLF